MGYMVKKKSENCRTKLSDGKRTGEKTKSEKEVNRGR